MTPLKTSLVRHLEWAQLQHGMAARTDVSGAIPRLQIYCKTTNFSVLLILAILVNGIKTLILIPANIYNQSRGRTR